jgi:hypothetical protein
VPLEREIRITVMLTGLAFSLRGDGLAVALELPR